MADKFLATNKKRSRELFEDRTVYKQEAFEPTPGATTSNAAIRDFWDHDNIYYGRLDLDRRPIIPKSDYLRNLKASANKSLYALDFVADAWLNLKRTAENRINDGCLPLENTDGSPEPYIGPFEPFRAYRDLVATYTKNMKTYLVAYERTYLQQGNYDKVLNYDDFLESFNNFMLNQGSGRLLYTLSSTVLSPYASILNTGLAIDISDLAAGSDPEKEDDFINNPRLNMYKNLAQEYGFYIDKNVPWRLVANLESSMMKKYITKRFPAYSDLGSLFERYYDHTTNVDIDLMKNASINFYNSFAARRRFEVIETRAGTCRTTKTVRRESISREDAEELYPNSYWIKAYITFRNLENHLKYEPAALAKIIKNAVDLEKAVDMDKAKDYINYKFDSFTSVPRSFAYESLADSIKERGLSSSEQDKLIELAAQSENLIVY